MSEQAVRDAFGDQAVLCEGLGSPLTGHLCSLFASLLDETTQTGRLCLNWQGHPSSGADNVPLRLCGGLHSLVLSGADETLAAAYYSGTSGVTPEVLRHIIDCHDRYLSNFMASPPQTNEVARAAALWPCLMAVCADDDLPLDLLEFGSSAGLNLNLDRFGYDLGGLLAGDQSSPLQLKPRWTGPLPNGREPVSHSRRGVDLSPFDLKDPHERLRLRSYVWPAQPDRLARLDAALSIADKHPVEVDRDDGISWLDQRLQQRSPDHRTVIFSTIAWQYMPPEKRKFGEAMIRDHMRDASSPSVWLRMEADGEEPGAALTGLWDPTGDPKVLGRADFHGRWIDWFGSR